MDSERWQHRAIAEINRLAHYESQDSLGMCFKKRAVLAKADKFFIMGQTTTASGVLDIVTPRHGAIEEYFREVAALLGFDLTRTAARMRRAGYAPTLDLVVEYVDQVLCSRIHEFQLGRIPSEQDIRKIKEFNRITRRVMLAIGAGALLGIGARYCEAHR